MTGLTHAIEIGLLILAAYLFGCVLGYGAHRLVRRLSAPAPVPTTVATATSRSAARRLAGAGSRDDRQELPDPGRPQRPPALPAPRGKPDDLRQIKGIGRKTESSLHDLGIYHVDQIAAWQPAHIDWLEGRIAMKGRIRREHWVEQATLLATATV